MESMPLKRKPQSEVNAKTKIKNQENSSEQLHVVENGSKSERPQRRGRPIKDATRVVCEQIDTVAISLPEIPNIKCDQEEEIFQTTVTNREEKNNKETCIMKLYDRRLDLSKCTENSPLYPICRAWVANQPRNAELCSYLNERVPSPPRKDNAGEVLSKLKSGEMKEVYVMPKPKKPDMPKIPSMNVSKTMKNCDDLLKLQEKFKDTTKEEMLAQHVLKWKHVKKKWIKHRKLYQQRYELNFLIIKELFKP